MGVGGVGDIVIKNQISESDRILNANGCKMGILPHMQFTNVFFAYCRLSYYPDET